MTHSFLVLIIALGFTALCGCRSPDPVKGYHRADDSRFSPRQREAIATAARYLEQQGQNSVDGYYRVIETPEGYSVVTWIPSGYDHGRPQFGPGDSAIVELRKDLTVSQYLPGY